MEGVRPLGHRAAISGRQNGGRATESYRFTLSEKALRKRSRAGLRVLLLVLVLILLAVSAAFGLLTYWPPW